MNSKKKHSQRGQFISPNFEIKIGRRKSPDDLKLAELRQVYSPGNANIPLATISSPKDQNKESNSPVSQRERIPSQEENNQLEEKKQDPEDVRDNIDFLRSNEKLDFEEIRRLHRAPL